MNARVKVRTITSPPRNRRKKNSASSATYVRNVQGQHVTLTLIDVDPTVVLLDPTNPRLRYSILQLEEAQRSDAACALLLTSQEETESLKRSIILSGGVQEPVYLRANGVVAEGNRRVVALRCLKEEFPDNERFHTIPAWQIADSTPEFVIQDLLSEIHLGSVRGWAPYEKGAQMRSLVASGFGEEEIGERYRMTSSDVRHHIAAVNFMDRTYFPMTADPTDPNHRSKFSYFLEFFKSGPLRERCDETPDLPDRFARWVRDQRIDTGAAVRRLPKILSSEAATRLLEVAGFDAAEECLARENPREQELYSLMEQARVRLENMTVNEMLELRDSVERQELLAALRDQIGERLAVLTRIRGKRDS